MKIVEFKNEAYALFENLFGRIDEELCQRLFRIGVAPAPEIPLEKVRENIDTTDMTGLAGGAEEALVTGEPAFKQPTTNNQQSTSNKKKLGRNDPCPCGSGKKWKRCHYPVIP